jgi:biotin carboxyl carrier protein
MSRLEVTLHGVVYQVEVDDLPAPDGQLVESTQLCVRVNGEAVAVLLPTRRNGYLSNPRQDVEWIMVNGRPYEITFDRELRWIRDYSGSHQIEVRDLDASPARPLPGDGQVHSPIPGQVTQVFVQPGQVVVAGEPLLILEAMKMHNELRAPRPGVVAAVHVQPGQRVTRGQSLVIIH